MRRVTGVVRSSAGGNPSIVPEAVYGSTLGKDASMTATPETNSFRIDWGGWQYVVDEDILYLSCRDETMAELPLTPVADGLVSTLGAWQQVADLHWSAAIEKLGTVHLGVREGHVAYWLDTEIPQFESLTCFPDTRFSGEHWQSYVSDGWDRLWDKDLDAEVGISSAYLDIMNVFGADGAGLTDPGDYPPTFVWNMPVRAFSLETDAGYLGVAMPGPLPVGVVRLTMRDRLFSVSFDTLRPACSDGSMPVIYFVPGLNEPYDILDEHRVIAERLGLTRRKSPDHPAWWTQPTFKAYLEHWRRTKDVADPEEQKKVLSTESLLDWTFTVKDALGVDEMLAIFEQGVYRCYGDYRPIDALGGVAGFRDTVDDLRSQGIRICYYIHPFMFNRKAPFYQEHPEAFCTPIDDSVIVKYACENYDAEPQFALVDWTHPKGREYMLSQVELILGTAPDCLNCDWLRSNHWRSPDPAAFRFHDPDWGIGDLMSMKVQKLIYEKAKATKPDCCVSKVAFAAPYMQPYADVNLLSEEWNGWTRTWYQRGRIATRTLRDVAFITDPYFLTITKSYEYYMSMLVWNILETPDVKHAIHPYLYFRELRDKDVKRRLAGCKVQENAPLNVTDLCRAEPPEHESEEPVIWRKRTHGPLAGWYAALALSKRAFVTYSETEARIGTSETRYVYVPLPPGAAMVAVEMVAHDGAVQPWPATDIGTPEAPLFELKAEDCAGAALYYRIRYWLGC